MGQAKNGGYTELPTLNPQQNSLLQQLLSQGGSNFQASGEGFKQFLPGGGGGQPIIDAAQQRFQQQTIPSILNAYGTGNKGSSALNQALAAGGANLNRDIASQLSQMQLQAAQGLSQHAGIGLNTPSFAYAPTQPPFWQQALIASIDALGNALSLGR